MRKLKILIMSSLLVLSSLLISAPASPVAALDSRCAYQAGIQFWENSNKGGKSIIFCGNQSHPNLNNIKVDPSCSLFCATWGNEISSAEVFNTTPLGHWTMYVKTNYNAGCPTCRKLITNGNTYIPYIGVFWGGTCCNDNIKSFHAYTDAYGNP